MIRRVNGHSMVPILPPGIIVFGFRWIRRHKPGHVIIFLHDSKEKIKRIDHIEENGELYVLGEHPAVSTDSRTFGSIDPSAVKARVVWPRTRPL
jgi:hypothetical protein